MAIQQSWYYMIVIRTVLESLISGVLQLPATKPIRIRLLLPRNFSCEPKSTKAILERYIVSLREIFAPLLSTGANHSAIICHHPKKGPFSNNLLPSCRQDCCITVKEGARLGVLSELHMKPRQVERRLDRTVLSYGEVLRAFKQGQSVGELRPGDSRLRPVLKLQSTQGEAPPVVGEELSEHHPAVVCHLFEPRELCLGTQMHQRI